MQVGLRGFAAGAAVMLASVVAVDLAEAAAVTVTVQGDQPVYLVEEGGVAHVGIRLTTAGGVATDRTVTVGYSTGGGGPVGTGAHPRTPAGPAAPGGGHTGGSRPGG